VRVGDGRVGIRILQERAIRVVCGRAAAFGGLLIIAFQAGLVEPGGGIDLAVRLDPGASRLGAHGGSRTVRTRRYVDGRDTSCGLMLCVLVAIGLYLTYVGLAAFRAMREELRKN
jgi:hypothetical protein